jgi:para-nitrobenzyl esterase
MNPIRISGGLISGVAEGEPSHQVSVYRGIPYAASTAGDNRWKPPQPVSTWEGILDCSKYRDAAPQEPPGMPFPYEGRSEDCLNLNVVAPVNNPTGKLPVMVWFHGGGYFSGSANNPLYTSIPLAQHGVVLVTVNHRLNLFGLMAHPLLSKESPLGISGNYLFLDLIASLQWVKNNITAFGGDPENVTIFGESSGSAKVSTLLASPLAKDLFHRAICASGSSVGGPVFGAVTLQQMEKNGEKLFTKLAVDKEKDPLKAARSIPWRDILKTERQIGMESIYGKDYLLFLWDAVVDGWFLQDTPTNIFRYGKQNVVPMICGVNIGEIYQGMVILPWLIPAYVLLLDSNNHCGGSGYTYMFDRVPQNWRLAGIKAIHGSELNYVLGLPGRNWDNILPGPKLPEPELSEADNRVSEAMMRMWVQFASTGNPSLPDLIKWPQWRRDIDL